MNKHTTEVSARDVRPSQEDPDIGVKHLDEIAAGLAEVLGDTYLLIVKTHAAHWNVSGPLFYSVHNLTEEQYENMFAAADELAERMRALGRLAPTTISTLSDHSEVSELSERPSAEEMIGQLAASHESLSRRLRRLIKVAEAGEDPVTEDLATVRAAFHDKAAWMLRAMIAS
ncbi:MAG: DNA starvation/stationary phase protection protein [Pseudomonadota bacterium]